MSDELNMTPLGEASVDEIMDEVLSRFEHAVFAGMRIPESSEDGKVGRQRVSRYATGNPHTVAGLCVDAQRFAIDQHLNGTPGEDGGPNDG